MRKVEIILDIVPCPRDSVRIVESGYHWIGIHNFLNLVKSRIVAAVDPAVYPAVLQSRLWNATYVADAMIKIDAFAFIEALIRRAFHSETGSKLGAVLA